MIILLIIIVVLIVACGASILVVFSDVSNWINDAEISAEERQSNPLEMDNTEYDYGHNVEYRDECYE